MEECMLCMKKYVLVRRVFTNGLNMDLSLQSWVEKTVKQVETYRFCKEKVPDTVVSKKAHTNCDMKGLITIDFLKKGATINNASYC